MPFFGSKTLESIRPVDIEKYLHAKQRGAGGRPLAIKTIRNHVNTIHSVFELGIRQGWCQTNPVKLADRPVFKKTETCIRFLALPEFERLLAADYLDDAWGRIEPVIYVTAAMTGLRQGELIALRWRDVDLDARRVRVVQNYVRGAFDTPKSENSSRSVPMASRVAGALRHLHGVTEFSRPSDLVFAPPGDRRTA